MAKQKDSSGKKPLSREEQEQGEGLKEVKTDAPSERFQVDQQVQNADSALDTQGANSSPIKKNVTPKGSQLKQEVVAKVLENQIAGGIPADISGRQSLSFSGNGGTLIGNAAGTPIVGKTDRSDTREGKKLDSVSKNINYVYSEQFVIPMDQSAPLSQSEGKVQGYNGTYRSEEARAQKNNGAVPGELMFQRSLDEIKRDHLYWGVGQVVKQQGVIYNDTPDTTYTISSTNEPVKGVYNLKRGNFLMRNLKIVISKDKKITAFNFDSMDCTPTEESQGIANLSSSAELRHINQSEIDRQNMDAKAGDEKADIWTPLARAVANPSQTVALLRDLEADTGNEVWISYKKAATSLSYTINKTAKDGLHAVRPMREMFTGSIVPEADSSVFAANGDYGDSIFQTKYYTNGSASLLIALFDSVGKYVDKGSVLVFPKSLKMHMQTADNNMNPLRVDEDFVTFVNASEVFSTIDRAYDAASPVMISDNAGVFHPYDWNDLFAFDSLDENGNPKFRKDPFVYTYHDLRNNYIVTVKHPLLEGIYNFIQDRAAKIYQVCGGDGSKDVTINIPIKHSTTHYSLWSFLVCAATPYILNCRVNSMRDVLYYEKNIEYPFAGLKQIKDCNPMDQVNYRFVNGYSGPIEVMQMSQAAAMTWVMPELFWPFDEETSDNTYKYVLPWYFSENSYTFDGTNIEIDDAEANMSWPSIRYGVRLAYLDDLYGMEERDVRLCMDIMTRPPVTEEVAGGVYKYSQSNDGTPWLTMSATQFSYKTYLSTPRQLGQFMVAPYATISSDILNVSSYNTYKGADAGVFGQSSYILKYWFGDGLKLFSVGDDQLILNPSQMNVSRSTNFQQNWNALPCLLHKAEDGLKDPGFVLGLGDMFTSGMAVINGRSQFNPFTNGKDSATGQNQLTDSSFAVVSLQKAMWTRVQYLPMAISPWDMVSSYTKTGEDAIKFDPFDFLYYFGFVGMRASDYREDVYNRSNRVDNMGLLFVKDPWIEASPLNRSAKKSSQI